MESKEGLLAVVDVEEKREEMVAKEAEVCGSRSSTSAPFGGLIVSRLGFDGHLLMCSRLLDRTFPFPTQPNYKRHIYI